MKIRNARLEDASEIMEISLTLTVPRNSKNKVGFIEYITPNENELKNRIRDNQFFFVIENSDKKIVGFLSAYTDEMLKKLHFFKDQIVQYILKKETFFVYLDQLAITKHYQKKGLGEKLNEHFISKVINSKYKKIYTSISHKNKIAIKLAEDWGWKQVGEIEVYGGLIFGIYRKEL